MNIYEWVIAVAVWLVVGSVVTRVADNFLRTKGGWISNPDFSADPAWLLASAILWPMAVLAMLVKTLDHLSRKLVG